MISFAEAADLLASAARPLGDETVPLAQAHGRVLASPAVAAVASPPVDASAMDGYAVREADFEALPAALRVAGESFAGRGFGGELPPGACVRIFTGAPVPSGADRVVVQEVVTREGDLARFDQPLSNSRHIREAGSDFRCGEVLLDVGTVLGPAALVAAAAADLAMLSVYRQPRLRILTTGDELVAPGRAREVPGAIPESVSFGVAALAAEWGGICEQSFRLPDDLQAMTLAAAQAAEGADLVVVTGGASVGEKDFAKAMFGDTLDLIFSKVAIKPGKPVWFGRVGDALALGLPGNPTSALVTARLFLAPLLCGLGGRKPSQALRWRTMPLAERLGPAGDRETFSRAVERSGEVHLLGNQDSSAQKALAMAEMLVRRPAGDQVMPAGSPVEVLSL